MEKDTNDMHTSDKACQFNICTMTLWPNLNDIVSAPPPTAATSVSDEEVKAPHFRAYNDWSRPQAPSNSRAFPSSGINTQVRDQY